MIKAKIVETNLKFGSLSRRGSTNKIVIHHTGSVKDVDFSAARIHELHLENGWSSVGKTDGSGCPGRNLQKMLDTISGKANWYRYNSDADVVDKKVCPTCGREI